MSADSPWHARRTALCLCAVLVLAAVLRFYGIGFGLPALRDPDEPMFVLGGLKLLRDHTLNPGWFGHPGTTTIYCIAAMEIGVFAAGHLAGEFANAHDFGLAVYHDPSLIFLPGRVVMAAGGIACVALTFVLGRRLFDDRVGLLAAALLAVNPLHIAFSQLIRTDIQASVFTLACMIFAVDVARHGTLRPYLLSALFAGLAIATKWPAAMCLASPLCAGLLRIARHPEERRRQLGYLALLFIATVASLLIVSPFLLLDYPTLLRDLHGEARPRHLGATGSGLIGNLGWYLGHALRDAIGVPGLLVTAIGIVFVARRKPLALAVLLPASLIFLFAISAQHLVWARWMLLLLPVLAIMAAAGVSGIFEAIERSERPVPARLAAVLLALALAAPMLATARAESTERLHDTRDLASEWAIAHVTPKSTVIVEQFAFDLLPQHWRLLFPLGSGGCIDVETLLGGRIRYSSIETLRGGQALVDIGTITPDKLPTCAADFAIFTDYDRYLAEAPHYAPELAAYAQVMRGGRQLAVFVPVAGRIGGPIVRIFKLDKPATAMRPSTTIPG